MTEPLNHRLLIVDDNAAIHDDFRKILVRSSVRDAALGKLESVLFEVPHAPSTAADFEIDSVLQGTDALEKMQAAVAAGRPYAVAFVDVRMPPGWDGIETIEHLWCADPALQIVICTAYSDYSWQAVTDRLGINDNLVILKKPFDSIEVLQLAHALTKKWTVTQQASIRMETLHRMVDERTRDLRNANEELRRSEERFAKAFQANPIPLAIQTVGENRFVDVNHAFEAMSRFSRAEVIGQNPARLRLCRDAKQCVLQRLNEKAEVRNVETQITTKAGELRQTLISTERITIAEEPHILVMIQDVTEQLRLESQLRQAQKMEAIGRLAAGVAHDFTNLLTIIQGHASLQLAAVESRANVNVSLEQIERAAERAAELTRQLLAFSSRQSIRLRPLQVADIINELKPAIQRLLGDQVQLQCSLRPGLPLILADPASLSQIITNLAINARDAMPNGGTLTIAAAPSRLDPADCAGEQDRRAGDFMCLRVSDTGRGMEEATRTRVFEPFFTTKQPTNGAGMGLATVYGLMKQHNGWIEVTSAPGKGAAFHLYLPITDKPIEPPEQPTTEQQATSARPTLLVVEDDQAVRQIVKNILVSDGYAVLEAASAEQALEIWRTRRMEIALLLIDVVMPGSTNGLALASALAAQKPELKVIYTSGQSSDLFTCDAPFREGINYLPKPYLSSKLTTIIGRALGKAS